MAGSQDRGGRIGAMSGWGAKMWCRSLDERVGATGIIRRRAESGGLEAAGAASPGELRPSCHLTLRHANIAGVGTDVGQTLRRATGVVRPAGAPAFSSAASCDSGVSGARTKCAPAVRSAPAESWATPLRASGPSSKARARRLPGPVEGGQMELPGAPPPGVRPSAAPAAAPAAPAAFAPFGFAAFGVDLGAKLHFTGRPPGVGRELGRGAAGSPCGASQIRHLILPRNRSFFLLPSFPRSLYSFVLRSSFTFLPPKYLLLLFLSLFLALILRDHKPSTQTWSTPVHVWSKSSDFGRNRSGVSGMQPNLGQMLVETRHQCRFGRNRIRLRRIRSKFGRHRSRFVGSASKFGPYRSKMKVKLVNVGRIRLEVGRQRPNLATCAPPSFRKQYCAIWRRPLPHSQPRRLASLGAAGRARSPRLPEGGRERERRARVIEPPAGRHDGAGLAVRRGCERGVSGWPEPPAGPCLASGLSEGRGWVPGPPAGPRQGARATRRAPSQDGAF